MTSLLYRRTGLGLSFLLPLIDFEGYFHTRFPSRLGTGTSVHVVDWPTAHQAALVASFTLQARDTIAEGIDISVRNATGEIVRGSDYHNVASVQVGWEAVPTSFRDALNRGGLFIGGLEGVIFNAKNYTNGIPIVFGNQTPLNLVPTEEETFYFPVAGDYSPTIEILFGNNTAPIQYTYSDIKVHVLSAGDIRIVHFENINVALTIALLAFAYIEAAKVIDDYAGIPCARSRRSGEGNGTLTRPSSLGSNLRSPPP